MEAIQLEEGLTVSLKEIYKKIFYTDDELVFLPFLNYHRINYEIGIEAFTTVDKDQPLYAGVPDFSAIEKFGAAFRFGLHNAE